jgi:excisionase family DNA binding protein
MGEADLSESKFLSVGQAARLLAVDDSTVRRWCRDGAIPALRVYPGGRWRISVDAMKRQYPDVGLEVG